MSAVDTGSITTPPAAASGEIARSDMRVIWLLLVAAFVAIPVSYTHLTLPTKA